MTKVLGFDTSGTYCGSALFDGTEVSAAFHEEMKKGQAERLMPVLEETLKEARSSWSDLDAIGVGIGPGNFTGIRISVSAARGLALALDRPAVGVNLFDALSLGTGGNQILTLAAPRSQFYLQTRFEGKTSDITVWSTDTKLSSPKDAVCIGQGSDVVSEVLNRKRAPAAFAPASAIARVASERYTNTNERPSPLYVRPADAAPSSEQTPKIL